MVEITIKTTDGPVMRRLRRMDGDYGIHAAYKRHNWISVTHIPTGVSLMEMHKDDIEYATELLSCLAACPVRFDGKAKRVPAKYRKAVMGILGF